MEAPFSQIKKTLTQNACFDNEIIAITPYLILDD